MATVIPYKDKQGNIISYQIQVYRGRDSNGKKLKPYTMSWKVPETYKSEKAIKKALEKIVGEFETECKRGEVRFDRRTFSEYANYYIILSERDNKIKTSSRYKKDLVRVNTYIGDIALPDLTTADLNKMYLELQKPGVRLDQKAICKNTDKLLKLIKQDNTTLIQFCRKINISDSTLRATLKNNNIAPETAEKISEELGVDKYNLFDFFVLKGEDNGLSGKTIRNYHNMIHVILDSAKAESIIQKNPADNAKPPRVRKKEAEFFEINEILQIRNALDSLPEHFMKYKIMLYLLIDLGIRKGELVGLRESSIDNENCLIRIEHNIQYEKGIGLYDDTPKSDEIRTLSVSPEVMGALSDYIAKQREYKTMVYGTGPAADKFNPQGYLFIQENGNVMFPSSLNHWLKKFESQNQLPHIYPHKFRHSQASLLYSSNIDPVTISKRLGHAQVSTTQNIYSHILKGSDKKAQETIANQIYNTNKKDHK